MDLKVRAFRKMMRMVGFAEHVTIHGIFRIFKKKKICNKDVLVASVPRFFGISCISSV